MARIAGVDLPREKRIEIGLTYIYGIGRKSANDILAATGVNPDVRVKDMDEDDVTKLRDYIDKHFVVEGDLRRDVALDIKRLIEIGCYRGVRHRKGLPVRGQRTKTNARTRKGPKKTIARRSKGRDIEKWLKLTTLRKPPHQDVVSAKTLSAALLISSLLLTIPLLLSQTHRATQFPGQARAVWASEAPENPPHLLHRPLRRPLQRLR